MAQNATILGLNTTILSPAPLISVENDGRSHLDAATAHPRAASALKMLFTSVASLIRKMILRLFTFIQATKSFLQDGVVSTLRSSPSPKRWRLTSPRTLQPRNYRRMGFTLPPPLLLLTAAVSARMVLPASAQRWSHNLGIRIRSRIASWLLRFKIQLNSLRHRPMAMLTLISLSHRLAKRRVVALTALEPVLNALRILGAPCSARH